MSSERMGIVAQKSNEKSTDCLKETSYFNTEKLVNTSAAFIARSRSSLQHKTESTYDRMFHVKEGYNSKLHRDDREHTQNLDVHSEVQYTSVDILQNHIFFESLFRRSKNLFRLFHRPSTDTEVPWKMCIVCTVALLWCRGTFIALGALIFLWVDTVRSDKNSIAKY